ncbi:MAG TPA: HAD family hydrolase [Thermoplasmata archaeon]|nr:HAD family hydrolase [Thermoplasmata archaeon]
MSSSSSPLRAVFFDLGGTLIDERNPEAWVECASASGIEVEPDGLMHAFGEVEGENDAVGNSWGAEKFWGRVLDRASGREVDTHRVRGFVACIRERGSAVHLFSDVRRCLQSVKKSGYRLGIISNSQSEAWVRAVLSKVRILNYFEAVISSGTEGVAKPDAEIFHRGLSRLGIRAPEAYHVGNLAHVDAKAAMAAGLHAVWLHRDGTGFGEDPPEITSLSELPGELAALRPR